MKTKNKVRTYQNTIQVTFSERGENFTLKLPHIGKWAAFIRFLKNRGFKVTENAYYTKQYRCLSKFHRIAFKGDVCCLLEIKADGIDAQFGHVLNLWKDMPQSFWESKSDNRYTHLSYLQEKYVELEISKSLDFFKKDGLVHQDDRLKLNPEQFIIDKLRNNTHIHGVVNCLNDIAVDMQKDNYNSQQNSWDKNKKKIICGEKKYFYDWRTKRMFCGTVWHNINNMWWVIMGDTFTNIASFELFDYDPQLPKRKKSESDDYEKLLKKLETKREYKKCIAINNILTPPNETHQNPHSRRGIGGV